MAKQTVSRWLLTKRLILPVLTFKFPGPPQNIEPHKLPREATSPASNSADLDKMSNPHESSAVSTIASTPILGDITEQSRSQTTRNRQHRRRLAAIGPVKLVPVAAFLGHVSHANLKGPEKRR
jgi:hypothetical protein